MANFKIVGNLAFAGCEESAIPIDRLQLLGEIAGEFKVSNVHVNISP